MSRAVAAFVLALALAPARPARADDTWLSAAVSAAEDKAQHDYDRAMLDGDDAVAQAVNADIVEVRQRLIERALASYELAAHTRPDQAEPHFRAASVLRAFELDCRLPNGDSCPMPAARLQRLIEHWEAFERLAPGDPRVAEDVLFERAVQRTKLGGMHGTDADLAAARDDYLKLLELRPDGDFASVLGNLAETYMMLGDLDRAIETYRGSLAAGADLSQEYGLAVALDRDEQGGEARSIVAARGTAGLNRFVAELKHGSIFFVPDGEQYYYLALASETVGNTSDAIWAWDQFIQSEAGRRHPQFAERARHNRDALLRAPRVYNPNLDEEGGRHRRRGRGATTPPPWIP